MYNGSVQQNPLCVESSVTKKFSNASLFSSTIFDPDANSVLLGHFLCYHKNVVLFWQKRTDLLSDNCFGLPTSYPAEILKCSFQDLSGAFDVREQARF